MNAFVTPFETMLVITNNDLCGSSATAKEWMDNIRRIDARYRPDMSRDLSRTLVFGHRTADAQVLPLDVFLNTACVRVPLHYSKFVDDALPVIVRYLVGTIRAMVPVGVANEMRFRLSLYIPTQHTDNAKLWNTVYFQTNAGEPRPTKTVLGDALDTPCRRYDLDFEFNEKWEVQARKKAFLDFNAEPSVFNLG